MYYRLQRQNSFGPYETKSTLVISRTMELKILDGESSIPNASPVVLESINKSLEGLINSHDRTKTVVHELPDFVKNTIISHCDLSEKELIDKRYGEYFEGYSLANNVQYIPVEIECLSNLDPDLCKSILALFVSVVFEYITEDKNSNVFELIKWGSAFLQRIGKMLNLNENEILTIIRPVSESLELKQLGMNFDDLRVEKQIHVNYILQQLEPMQESIDEFFKQTMGTFDDENDFDYNEDDFKDDESLFKNEFEDHLKLHEKLANGHKQETEHLHEEKDKKDNKKDKKHSSKENKEKKKDKKESSKKSKKKEKEGMVDEFEQEKVDVDINEKLEQFEKYNNLVYDKMQPDVTDNQEFYEVEMESEDEEEAYFKKNFVDNYKPKKKKSKEQFDIKDLMSFLEPDDEDDVQQEEDREEEERDDQEEVEKEEQLEEEKEDKEEVDEQMDDLNTFESLDSVEVEEQVENKEDKDEKEYEDVEVENEDKETKEEKDMEEEYKDSKENDMDVVVHVDKNEQNEQVVLVDRLEYSDTRDKLEEKENKEENAENDVKEENEDENVVEYNKQDNEEEKEDEDEKEEEMEEMEEQEQLEEEDKEDDKQLDDDVDEEYSTFSSSSSSSADYANEEEVVEEDSASFNPDEDMEAENVVDEVQLEYKDMSYALPETPRNTLFQQEEKKEDRNEEEKEEQLEEELEEKEADEQREDNKENENEEQVEDEEPVVMDLSDLKIEEPQIDRQMSESGLTESSKTNMGDEQEVEEEDLLKVLERSLNHKSSLPTNDYDNLLNDISNLNLPPKKNKSITSKILSNISKKINRVFSISSEKSSRMTYTSSMQSGVNFYPNQDYLNNLLLIEKSPYIVAVLIRNLVLKYIISGYNDSRVQVVFERFSNLLGVSSSSVLSIENNIVSDLAGILDVSAAKTTSKKMSRRLKILSATVGGTALLALTAGVASPVLAVGMAFLGLGGTGVSSYLSSNEGSNILKNIFGMNVSLTHYKVKREHLTNLQFIQLNPKANMYRDSIREPESNRFSSGRDSTKTDSARDKEEVNNNFIGICICVGNNVFLNEIFFFENDSIDFKSVETIRHLDSEYIDIWKRQFPVPISDLYLLKWESKLMASLHRMLLKLNSLSIYQKSLELYQITYNTEFTSKTLPNNYDHYYSKKEPNNLLMFDDVRDSSGGSKYTNLEGSSGSSDNHCSKINKETGDQKDTKDDKENEENPTEPVKDFYKDFKDVRINWPVGLIQLCSNLDNCWLVCRNRAETCGMLLANAICDKLLTGDRHISLVGYSFGARVIFYCLLTLFQRNKFHVVKDVVLMGLPSTAGYNEWTKCTCVVAGRIINVYNENDWVLAFLYRYTANYRVAGLAPVIHERVENYNVTNLFSSHVDYLENISKITSFLNIHI